MAKNQTDADLAKVLEEGDDLPAVEKKARASVQGKPAPKRSLGLLAALLVMAAAVGLLVSFSLKDAAVYAKTVDQLMASKASMVGRRVRVEGTLIHGSLMKRDQPCEYRFKVTKNNAVLEVRYAKCVIPDTFQDREEGDVGVTAEGMLTRDGTFEATQIMAKCPSKYEEKDGKKTPVGMN
jgi:cytochrome c-type biogenesis protein CcmE